MGNRNKATLLLALEGLGSGLYFSVFAFFLINLGYSYSIVSWTIAATTLSGIFVGPRFGAIIDNSNNKSKILVYSLLGALFSLIAIYISPYLHGLTSTPILFLGIITFAIFNSPLSLIISQYIVPCIQSNDSQSYILASKIGAIVAIIISLIGFTSYNTIGASGLLLVAIIMYFIATLLAFFSFGDFFIKSRDKGTEKRQSLKNYFKLFYKCISEQSPVLYPVLIIAFTVDSVEANVPSIVSYLDMFALNYVFLFGIVVSLVSYIAVKVLQHILTDKHQINGTVYQITLGLYIISFSMFLISQFSSSSMGILFLIFGAIILIFAEQWWSVIFILWMRKLTHDNDYASALAILKIPRSLVTFLGVGFVGVLLDFGYLKMLVLISIFLIVILMIYNKKNSLQNKDYAIYVGG